MIDDENDTKHGYNGGDSGLRKTSPTIMMGEALFTSVSFWLAAPAFFLRL
jgi:hypothetical protein